MTTKRRLFEHLDEDACWLLLSRRTVGRLAVAIKGQPDVFPVNYRVDGETIVIQTNPGLKLAAATLGAGVAFEVDDLNEMAQLGCSVVVRGSAYEIEDLDELLAAQTLLVSPWDDDGKTRYVRILPTEVNGRRFVKNPVENRTQPA